MSRTVAKDRPKLVFSVERMVRAVRDGRKDHLLIDFSRQICTRFADMVQHFSELDGNRQSAHNNKTLFAEAIHLWFGHHFAEGMDVRGPITRDPREVIEHVMTYWYEAMSLEDPEKYRARFEPPPIYVGDFAEAVSLEMACAACMEIQPLSFRFGLEGGKPVHVWARIYADGKWYDSDISQPDYRLGDAMQFDDTEDVEVPL